MPCFSLTLVSGIIDVERIRFRRATQRFDIRASALQNTCHGKSGSPTTVHGHGLFSCDDNFEDERLPTSNREPVLNRSPHVRHYVSVTCVSYQGTLYCVVPFPHCARLSLPPLVVGSLGASSLLSPEGMVSVSHS